MEALSPSTKTAAVMCGVRLLTSRCQSALGGHLSGSFITSAAYRGRIDHAIQDFSLVMQVSSSLWV